MESTEVPLADAEPILCLDDYVLLLAVSRILLRVPIAAVAGRISVMKEERRPAAAA